MAGQFCVNLTCAKDNTDKATVAFVLACAALGSEKETVVFLSTEGVRIAEKGYADDVHEGGFPAFEGTHGQLLRGRRNHICMRALFQQTWPEPR